MYPYKKKQINAYNKAELYDMLDCMILLCLDGIVKYKTRDGFGVQSLHNITDIETQAPTSFQERFFLFMDILEPVQGYALHFIHHKHPDAEYLFKLLLNLYNSEVQMESSSEKEI